MTAIEPGALLEVLANIDLGTRRWQRKAQIIGILGRWGEGHNIGLRELRRRTGISFDLLETLLAELVTARVVEVIELGTGRRVTAWAVSADIERWRGVPWLREVDAIERWAFHVEHDRYTNCGQRSERGSYPERKPKQRSERGSYPERKKSQRSEGGSYPERKKTPAFRSGGVGGALTGGSPEKGFSYSGNTSTSSPFSGDGGEAAGIDPAEWESLRRLVMHAGGGAYLRGRAATALAQVVETHGVEQVRSWVLEAPKRLGVPLLVDWLAGRAFEPTADELAALEARPADELAALEARPDREPDQPAPVVPAGPDPTLRPVLRPVAEVIAPADAAASSESVRAALRAARGHLDPFESPETDRITTEV